MKLNASTRLKDPTEIRAGKSVAVDSPAGKKLIRLIDALEKADLELEELAVLLDRDKFSLQTCADEIREVGDMGTNPQISQDDLLAILIHVKKAYSEIEDLIDQRRKALAHLESALRWL